MRKDNTFRKLLYMHSEGISPGDAYLTISETDPGERHAQRKELIGFINKSNDSFHPQVTEFLSNVLIASFDYSRSLSPHLVHVH